MHVPLMADLSFMLVWCASLNMSIYSIKYRKVSSMQSKLSASLIMISDHFYLRFKFPYNFRKIVKLHTICHNNKTNPVISELSGYILSSVFFSVLIRMCQCSCLVDFLQSHQSLPVSSCSCMQCNRAVSCSIGSTGSIVRNRSRKQSVS